MFGDYLKARRENLSLSRRQVAKQVGCHPSHIANLEKEEECGSYDLLVRLAGVYGDDACKYLMARASAKGDHDFLDWLRSHAACPAATGQP